METCKRIIKKAMSFMCADPVLSAAIAAALLSAIFVPPSRDYLDYLDLRVICLLLAMMLVVAGLQKVGVFEILIERLLKLVKNTRMLSVVLVGVCFFSSMLITNDVALITFVPLGVLILTRTKKQRLLIPVIVLQTVAANLGSMLTPLGNPQNLYLYSVSNMKLIEFLGVMAVPTLISFILLFAASFLVKAEKIEPVSESKNENVKKIKSLPWILLFIVSLLSVLRIIPYGVALAAVIIGVLILDRDLLFRADYGLLFTFAFLFIFIGNIKSVPEVSAALSALVGGRELTVGILLSQVISNVPAAMLLSKFTTNYSELLIGVNLGGLGTLIASMASVISYKLYASTEGAQKGRYLAVFTAVNLLFLAVIWVAIALLT